MKQNKNMICVSNSISIWPINKVLYGLKVLSLLGLPFCFSCVILPFQVHTSYPHNHFYVDYKYKWPTANFSQNVVHRPPTVLQGLAWESIRLSLFLYCNIERKKFCIE